METYLFWIVPIASLLALALAWYFYKQMMLESEGTPTMEKIASYVRQGGHVLSETTIQGGRAGISGISYSLFYHWHTASTYKIRGCPLLFLPAVSSRDFPVFWE